MKKLTMFVLLFVFVFGFGFGSMEKASAGNCDEEDIQWIDWGSWNCYGNPCNRWVLECGTDLVTGEPCSCQWECRLMPGCDPENPPNPQQHLARYRIISTFHAGRRPSAKAAFLLRLADTLTAIRELFVGGQTHDSTRKASLITCSVIQLSGLIS